MIICYVIPWILASWHTLLVLNFDISLKLTRVPMVSFYNLSHVPTSHSLPSLALALICTSSWLWHLVSRWLLPTTRNVTQRFVCCTRGQLAFNSPSSNVFWIDNNWVYQWHCDPTTRSLVYFSKLVQILLFFLSFTSEPCLPTKL